MSDAEIEEMAARLEAAARIEDAKYEMDSDWDERMDKGESGPASQILVANRVGFLHLAAQLLRCATANENEISVEKAKPENPHIKPISDQFERREIWKDEPEVEEENKSLFWQGVGCNGIIALVICLLLVGLSTVYRWIFSWF
jgi:hypothetical protein